MKISGLIPIHGDMPVAWVRRSLDSIVDQTLPIDELVAVVNGGDPRDILSLLHEFEARIRVRVVDPGETGGLGHALQVGLQECRHPLVARFDADDLNRPSRIAMQHDRMTESAELTALGSSVEEFEEEVGDLGLVRAMPADPEAIGSMAWFRCPMNHMSVMFRRDAVLESGGYRDLRSMEDWDLWLRLLARGHRLANLEDILVDARRGQSFWTRRGGIGYAKAEAAFLNRCRREGILTPRKAWTAMAVRVPLRLLPRGLLRSTYRRFGRIAHEDPASDGTS